LRLRIEPAVETAIYASIEQVRRRREGSLRGLALYT